MDYSLLSSQELRTANQTADAVGRSVSARIGALWYYIEKNESWRDWGFVSFADAISEEGPRSFTTIIEMIQNYRFFVIQNNFSYEEYESLLIKLGIRKVTLTRREDRVNIPQVLETQENRDLSAVPVPMVEPTQQEKKERVIEVANKVEKLSVADAQKMVRDTAKKNGVKMAISITRKYHWNEEQDKIVQQDISLIKSRAQGRTVPMSDSVALAYLVAEHLSVFGSRQIVDPNGAVSPPQEEECGLS